MKPNATRTTLFNNQFGVLTVLGTFIQTPRYDGGDKSSSSHFVISIHEVL